ncbi:MAG: hypothetical protein E7265_11075 [Lachnospiraceae bacterium]|nr:hypothetical protein [Lachnospiraceae bacterium]
MINPNNVSALLSVGTTILIVLAVILTLVIIALVVLTIVGKRMQKKQEEGQAAMQQAAQTISMLVIDKKRMKLKEAGLPSIVLEQTPKYARLSKLPVVKAKVGPKIMTFICDEKVFQVIPIRKEVKVVLSGIYIMDIKGSRARLETPTKKQGFMARLRSKAQENLKNNKK